MTRLRKGVLGILAGLGLMAAGAALTVWGVKTVQEELSAESRAGITAEETLHGPHQSAGLHWLRALLGRSLFLDPRLLTREVGRWTFTHRSANGSILWQAVEHNALVDVGEQRLLEIYFRDATEPGASEFLFLSDASNPCSIAETDSLATAATGEPSTNGYGRQTIERSGTGWPTSALDTGDWQITSTVETFSASGGSWGPVNCAGLATTSDNTGDFLAFVALSQARTLASGESLDVSLKIKLQ